jgi:hypothetical protein
VLFTWDGSFATRFWLIRDYLPEIFTLPGMRLDEVAVHLGAQEVIPVPIPADCEDGFFHAFWARPQAYLDPQVRAGTSPFARLEPRVVERAVAQLERDLASGAWHERNAELAGRHELDLGYRLLVAG